MILRKARENDYAYIKRLYKEAFPLYERMPFFLMRRKSEKGEMDILIAEKDSMPCSLAIPSCCADMVLLNYFAVDSNARGQGIGSEVIEALQEMYGGKRIIIEIEKPDSKKPNTVRRKTFYLRNGFKESGLDIKLAGTPMEILTFGGKVSADEYLSVYEKIFGRLLTAAMVKVLG